MASIVKRPNGRWQATYRGPDGRERSKIFDRKLDGDRWLRAEQTDQSRGVWFDASAGKITLAEFAASWRQLQQWRDGTRRSVDNTLDTHLLPVLGGRQIASIRRSDLQAWVNNLDLAPATVKTKWAHVVSLFHAAQDEGCVPRSERLATDGVKRPEIVRTSLVPLSVEEVWALEDAAPDWYRAVITLGAGLGLRRGETLGLTLDRVDFLHREVRIDRQLVAPKTGPMVLGPLKTRASYRVLEASDVVLEALAAHVARFHTRPDGFLFVTPDRGVPVRNPLFDTTWHQIRAKAKVRADATSHDLRHHFASVLIAAGCSVPVVQKAMGHATPMETLNTYTHWWPQDKGRTRTVVDAAHRRPVSDVAESSRN